MKCEDVEYLRQLKKLKSLSLAFDRPLTDLESIAPVIHQIVASNIQLKELKLQVFSADFNHDVDELVEEVLKLKKLQKLSFHIPGLTLTLFDKFTKYISELRELQVSMHVLPTPAFISKMIQNADKLQFLYIYIFV